MTEIALRFDHRDKKGCACCDRGPSLLVNQTALFLGDVWAGRAGVGD